MSAPAGSVRFARRVGGYSAGSVVAAVTSEAAFTGAYGWGHAGTVWASAAGFVGGAVPNYILNRRWAWPDRRTDHRLREALRYGIVSLVTFLASAVATHYAERQADGFTVDHGWRVALVAAAFLGVSAVFFVLKFVLYQRLVFTGPSAPRGAATGTAAVSGPAAGAVPEPAPEPPAATGRSPGGRTGGRSPAGTTTSSPPPERTGNRR